MTKHIKYFLFFLFLFGCGYTPIYEVNQKINFGLDEITYSGDKKIGRQIENCGLPTIRLDGLTILQDLILHLLIMTWHCLFWRQSMPSRCITIFIHCPFIINSSRHCISPLMPCCSFNPGR